jgi:hypothetical protein
MIFGGIFSVKTKPAKYTLMVYDPDNKVRKTGFENSFNEGVTFNGSVELPSNFLGYRASISFLLPTALKTALILPTFSS